MNKPLLFTHWCLLVFFLAGGANAAEYTLGPGDIVQISVYGQPDLDTTARIRDQNTITFPLLGEIKVGGLTEAQAERALAAQLAKRGVVRSPEVKLTVQEYHSRVVSVLGNVTKPGEYVINDDATVTELLSKAGGLAAEAGDVAIVIGKGEGSSGRQVVDLQAVLNGGDRQKDLTVGAGEVIYVPPAPKVYVYGEVNHPGAYRLSREMTVMQAISMAGGLTNRGTDRGLTVRRKLEEKPKSLVVNLDDPLQANDVVYVQESFF